MGCDLVVALGPATVNGHTLFGQNGGAPPGTAQVLRRAPGRSFTAGETLALGDVQLPQARQTFTVLGGQPPGCWGYPFGVNEHRLAAGCTTWSSHLRCDPPGLRGPDLVRLVLERCRSARQAVDLLTDLVQRYGQGRTAAGPDRPGDHVFLVADPAEAFAVEAAGRYWVVQEIHQVRAVSDVAVVRQDWDRIAPGLAGHAIARQWWPEDGSKLDFVGALSAEPVGQASALRRWGRATLLLEQQNGHIDAAFVQRLFADHYDGTHYEVDPLAPAGPEPLCQHGGSPGRAATAASLVADLDADPGRPALAWCAFGPPCTGVYFPVFLDGELPAAFTRGGTAGDGSLWWRGEQLRHFIDGSPQRWALVREALGRLQARFDLEADEFTAEAVALRRRGGPDDVARQAGLLLQHHLERFEDLVERLAAPGGRRAFATTAGQA